MSLYHGSALPAELQRHTLYMLGNNIIKFVDFQLIYIKYRAIFCYCNRQ